MGVFGEIREVQHALSAWYLSVRLPIEVDLGRWNLAKFDAWRLGRDLKAISKTPEEKTGTEAYIKNLKDALKRKDTAKIEELMREI